MSGNNVTVTCRKCGASCEPRGKAMTVALTCPSCYTYFCVGDWDTSVEKFEKERRQALPLGAKGRIDGFLYEVMGFVIKQDSKYHFQWREFLLFNPYRGYAFLSEYDGNWNFLWPIESDPRPRGDMTDFYHEERSYRRYQRGTARVVYANGEFFFDVVGLASSTVTNEYISPPYMLSFEKSDDSILWCQGEYMTRQEVASAFNVATSTLPIKNGLGYTEPVGMGASEKLLAMFTFAIVIVTCVIHSVINTRSADKVVFQASYTDADLTDQKLIAIPSFDLEGGTKNLAVTIYSPVSNDWFFSELSLINDNDGTEYNFTKEVEYYSGFDDEGHWSEGSQEGQAILSSIPEGRYHINIYPEFSTTRGFSIVVKRDIPMTVNLVVTLMALLLFPLGYLIYKYNREVKRWSESDYSPYSQG